MSILVRLLSIGFTNFKNRKKALKIHEKYGKKLLLVKSGICSY